MADEYGNLEVGIELLDEQSENLPKLRTITAVYVWSGVRDDGKYTKEFLPMNLAKMDAIPEGYMIAGFMKSEKTATAYTESTISNRTNVNMFCSGPKLQDYVMQGKIGRFIVPDELMMYTGTFTIAANRTAFAEVTVTLVVAPCGWANMEDEYA